MKYLLTAILMFTLTACSSIEKLYEDKEREVGPGVVNLEIPLPDGAAHYTSTKNVTIRYKKTDPETGAITEITVTGDTSGVIDAAAEAMKSSNEIVLEVIKKVPDIKPPTTQ